MFIPVIHHGLVGCENFSGSFDDEILKVLGMTGGLMTGEVAGYIKPYHGMSKKQHSHYVRKRLLSLEAAGLVRRLDDKKPVCWVKV